MGYADFVKHIWISSCKIGNNQPGFLDTFSNVFHDYIGAKNIAGQRLLAFIYQVKYYFYVKP